MRVQGNLNQVDPALLRTLRANFYKSYYAVSKEETDALLMEVDRLIFPDAQSAEDFLRHYVEPQLRRPGSHPEIWLLNSEKVFNHLCATLSIEWLQRFPNIKITALNGLFNIAAQHANWDDLKEIIVKRCLEFMSNWPNPTENEDIEKRRTFWLVRAWYFLNDAPEAYWNWLKEDKGTVLILNDLSGRMSFDAQSHWPKLTSTKVEAILDAFIERWPKVNLPSHWGTDSPAGEKAYRFLTDVIWSIDLDEPDEAIPVLKRLLSDSRFTDLHNELKSIHAGQVRKRALRDFEPPTPQEIVSLLDCSEVVTVEGLRQLLIQELQDYQKDIRGGEFNLCKSLL